MGAGIKLFVGLGNPGPDYQNTRHNAGVWFLSAIANKYSATLKSTAKFKGLFASVTILDSEIKLLFPTTFMNLSGQAVQAVAHFYKISPEEILILHDELDFLPGIVRLKFGGGANGHNGLQDIISKLGSNDFYRARIGIGKPIHKQIMTDYVLNKPTATEKRDIEVAIERALQAVPDLIQGDFAKATQELNSI